MAVKSKVTMYIHGKYKISENYASCEHNMLIKRGRQNPKQMSMQIRKRRKQHFVLFY